MLDKTCLITGGTSGIGKETAMGLARMNATVIFTAIDKESGEETKREIVNQTGNNKIDFFVCDLASFDSIRRFCVEFSDRYEQLHVLINNAAVLQLKRNKSKDGIEMTFAVNYLAPFLLIRLLESKLQKSAPSRIINVASRAHLFVKYNFDDIEGTTGYRGMRAYAQSKLALVSLSKYMADKLECSGVTVNCVHPGRVNTPMINPLHPILRGLVKLTMVSSSKGAEPVIYLASSEEVSDVTGAYFHKQKLAQPSKIAVESNNITRLIELSEEYILKSAPQ